MALQLRTSTTLAEALHLVPRTHMGPLTVALTHIPGDLSPSSGLPEHLHPHMHFPTQTLDAHNRKVKLNLFKMILKSSNLYQKDVD